MTEPVDLQEHADAMFAELYDSDPDYITLYYRPEDNDVGIAYGENVAAVLTEDDEDAIRAAFAAPETDDGYTHVLNGMKQLNICVFDGGDYAVPDLSYTAQFLREPDAVPAADELPMLLLQLSEPEANEVRLIELSYLANEMAGLTELAKILFADGSREYDPNSGIALALDPDAFAESGTTVPTVWIAVAAIAAFALAAVAVIVCKKRAH